MATQQEMSKGKGSAQNQARTRTPSPAARSAQGTTSERDEVYGLISVLYHSLQGAETNGSYAADARRAGDEDLARFFDECVAEDNERAARAKSLLASRVEEDLEDEDEDEDDEDEDDEEEEEEQEEDDEEDDDEEDDEDELDEEA